MKITNKGFIALAESLESSEELENLKLSFSDGLNRITDKGAVKLFGALKKLRRLIRVFMCFW